MIRIEWDFCMETPARYQGEELGGIDEAIQYIAIDYHGDVYGYTFRPYPDINTGQWLSDGFTQLIGQVSDNVPVHNWQSTLERVRA